MASNHKKVKANDYKVKICSVYDFGELPFKLKATT